MVFVWQRVSNRVDAPWNQIENLVQWGNGKGRDIQLPISKFAAATMEIMVLEKNCKIKIVSRRIETLIIRVE